MDKATTAESLERQRYISQMLIQGYQRYDIVKYAQKEWGIGHDMVDRYIAKCREGFKEEWGRDRTELLNEAQATNKDIQQKAYKREDFRLALQANKENAELTGLKTIKSEVKVKVENMDIEAVKKILTKEQREQLAASSTKETEPD